MAAKPQGEEKRSATSRGTTPARLAAIGALAAVVIVLAIVLFSGDGKHKYTFLFQNAGQLVNDNQVLVGGSPVGTVSSIELSSDNLAEVNVELEQELHEGTTAVIRATSLSGVANHYLSISPGPNSSPALDEGATLGLGSTTTPVDIDQFFNMFPPKVREGLQNFIKGNGQIYAGRGKEANESYKYFGTALNRTTHFAAELNADEQLLSRFLVSSAKLTTAVAGRGPQLSNAISNATTAFNSINTQNVALDQSLQELPPVLRQANTTFVNLRAALDDLEPLINTAKPATKNLAPFLAELRPVLSKFIPFTRNLGLALNRPGQHNDTQELLAALPTVQGRASRIFPHAEAAIAAFQPQLNFARSYTPDLFNALGRLGAAAGAYDGNGNYVRASISAANLFQYGGGKLTPITRAEQFNGFTATSTPRRCPGGATNPAADNSNPYVNPPHEGSSVTPSECDPSKGSGK
ncbi:MAG TPA: MlaD family protein [Solirubrobacterales bacterium]|nr:MlaD family protein [Solirubrobacterales bacterium]